MNNNLKGNYRGNNTEYMQKFNNRYPPNNNQNNQNQNRALNNNQPNQNRPYTKNHNHDQGQNTRPNAQMFRDDNNDNNNSFNYVKKTLIEYISRTVNLSNYKYKMLEYEHDLQLLKEKSYMVSPNYGGINGLLIFMKHEDKYLSFVIDKKFLTYNLDKVDYNKVKIIQMNCRLDDSIYKGTIMDGVLLTDNRNGGKKFVINDMYYFRGESLTDDKIAHKLLNVASYFESNKIDSSLNDCSFIVNKLYKLDEIDNIINKYIPQLPSNNFISGVAFYSEFSASKLIYLFNNATNNNNDKQKNQVQQTQSVPIPNYPSDTNPTNNEYVIIETVKDDNVNIDTLTFKAKQTSINDVYNLYLGSILPNKTFKYNKIGIACIPTIECSFFCRDTFINSNGMDVLMDCKHDALKNVWIPVKLNTDKRKPDLMTKLDNFKQQ